MPWAGGLRGKGSGNEGRTVTEGDELAMQAQWIDLLAFDLLMGRLDAAKEHKEALDEPAAVLSDRRPV